MLYELINTRMLTERPTIYTTNITDQSVFAARYTEKVASRMLGGCKMFMFMGDDQRMKQGYFCSIYQYTNKRDFPS